MKNFILETLRIQPKHLADFTDEYHHKVLPTLIKKIPGISISRYEEFGVASSLAWFSQRHITVYKADLKILKEFSSHLPNIAINNPEGVYFYERELYEEIYVHQRNQERMPFGCRPFFVVAVDVNPVKHNEFTQWYHQEYLPKTLADTPTWSSCHRYRAQNIKENNIKEITIYEADNEADLNRGFELLRAPYRYASNAAWASFVGDTILAQDAMSFRPILVLP